MIKVVLLKTVKNLGTIGDIVSVKPGYAKNFLIPFGMSLFANSKIVEKIQQNKEKFLAHDLENVDRANFIKDKLLNVVVEIKKQSFQDGKIYGSVSSKEVSSVLWSKFESLAFSGDSGVNISNISLFKQYFKPSNLIISSDLKHLGEFSAVMAIYGDVTLEFTISVTSVH